ncbi:putative salt-induced outer membrane protein [Limimaricola cinnabarinus LL-001]|uniref:Putative salt-induced outer membrane protein n=1 Tax=Limimaricola cinnabarinus LL-001 TaxID=1337093 RepID=U2Z668_9RHOB|nr:putative salt-induced outer membrane protein [Limimaricola cinnabarinus LL-001]
MNATYKLLMASTILGLVGTTAMAQSFDDVNSPVFSNENQLDDNLEDLDEDIEDDFEVDTPTFGNEGRELGFTGSISARGTATSGNTDTSTIGLGARFGFFDGVNGHEVKLSYSYFDAEDDADDLNRLLAGYDYTRDFSDTFYGFGTAVVAYDEDDSFETDAFIAPAWATACSTPPTCSGRSRLARATATSRPLMARKSTRPLSPCRRTTTTGSRRTCSSPTTPTSSLRTVTPTSPTISA